MNGVKKFVCSVLLTTVAAATLSAGTLVPAVATELDEDQGSAALELEGEMTPSGWVLGCRLAPGGIGANICVNFSKYENYVGTVESRYDPGVATWPDNICRRHHQVMYKKKGASAYTTKTKSYEGCIPGIGFRSQASFYPEAIMQSGSQVCARAKNSRTDDEWTVWSCKTVSGTL